MKNLKPLLLVGGALNLLLAVFHIVLCRWIYVGAHDTPFYPLMQMLGVGGCVLIWFLALTSLFLRDQLATSPAGRSILLLNVVLYVVRIAGELILFPQPKPIIIVVCAVLAAVYGWILFQARKAPVT